MPFSDELRRAHADYVDDLTAHPFLDQVAAGSIPRSCLQRFLEQDLCILAEEARVFGVAVSRASTLAEAANLSSMIHQLNADEHERHRILLEHLGSAPNETAFEPLPTTYAYATHLRARAADGHRAEMLAALLPCAHVYRQFGRRYADAAPANPIHATWMRPYQDGSLDSYIETHAALLNDAADGAGEGERAAAHRAFAISLYYEHAYLDMAWHGEAWTRSSPLAA